MTRITDYSSNNRGAIPQSLIQSTGGKSFVQNYLGGGSSSIAGSEYQDPQTGSGYEFQKVNADPPNTPVMGDIYYDIGKKCGTDGDLSDGSGRQFTLRIFLENQTALYCVDNH
jgi:hypothetical protein